jgi:hypothetical protein
VYNCTYDDPTPIHTEWEIVLNEVGTVHELRNICSEGGSNIDLAALEIEINLNGQNIRERTNRASYLGHPKVHVGVGHTPRIDIIDKITRERTIPVNGEYVVLEKEN